MGSATPLEGDTSPLRRFAACKDEIRRVFRNLHEIIEETRDFLSAIDSLGQGEFTGALGLDDGEFDLIHRQKDINQFREVVEGISHLLERDNMKVVFVGHTSNGKSTVINTMLGDIVLPMGIGHTTHCFCSVQGTTGEPYMQIGDGRDKNSITTVKQVAHALSPEAADDRHQIVHIFWDKAKCKLLSDGVTLMDTPGLDIDENYDMWIDKYCMDADVFVLVANGESTLKQTEMTFLKRMSEKLSRPNVFVLFNRWDGSDMEEDAESVREQHLAKASKFLTGDLHLAVSGTDRVFFVSAREMLAARVKKPGIAVEDEAVKRRMQDFARFESNFAECLSESAIRTKFESHVVRAQDITDQLDTWLQKITWATKMQQTEWRARLDDRMNQLQALDAQRDDVMAKCERSVDVLGGSITDHFEQAFADVLSEHLADIINSFDWAVFSDDNLDTYKERLVDYVGKEMCAQLQSACGQELDQTYRRAQQTMARCVEAVVPEGLDFRVQGLSQSPIAPTMFTTGLLDSFHEDIGFRFSLGWASIGPRLLGGSAFATLDGFIHDKRATDVALLASAPLTSAYVPLLTVGATLATKPTVWKLVLYVVGAWAALYGFERLAYTNAAKERRFKQQFTHHAGAHYQLVLLHASLNVRSHYVAAAQSQLDRLRWQVDERKGMLRKEIGLLERAVTRISKVITTGDAALSHCRSATTDLRAFIRAYLPAIAKS